MENHSSSSNYRKYEKTKIKLGLNTDLPLEISLGTNARYEHKQYLNNDLTYGV